MLYAFGDVELDERRFELRRGGVARHVQPKVLDLLLLLARAGDRVVAKQELHERLWPGVRVSEASLTRLIVEARRTIGDDEQRVLVTVRSRGFRLAVPVARRAGPRSDAFPGGPASGAVEEPASSAGEPAFVGRATCLAVTATKLKQARAGVGGIVWLSGERGIGKSRVLARIGRQAEALGFRVGVGHARRSPDAPPFWLWREALPELNAAFPLLSTGPAPSGVTQFSFFDAIARHLADASAHKPLALLFDDLHLADHDSLQLLEFLAPAVGRNAIVVVGAYWDAGIEPGTRGEALVDALGQSSGTVIPLRALSLDEIAQFAEAASGVSPSADFVRILLERSGGNPLYAQRVLATDWARKSLAASADEQPSTMDLQQDLLSAISRHLVGLSMKAVELLTSAAVLGRKFDIARLGVVTGLPAGDLLQLLDEGVKARVLSKGDDGQLQFAHGLVRDVLYKRLPSAERSRRHAEAAEKLLAHYGKSYERHLQELASHFALALPHGDIEKAIELAMRAATAEVAADRHLIAAKYWQYAARALALVPGGDPRQLDVSLGLARAWRVAGREQQAKEAFQDVEILKRVLQ